MTRTALSSPRRGRKWLLLVALAALTGWGVYAERQRHRQAEPPLVGFPDVVAAEVKAGWRVVQEPDLPGPYRRQKQEPLWIGKGERGRFIYGGKTYELPSRPDVEQMAVPLTTENGKVTVAVLER